MKGGKGAYPARHSGGETTRGLCQNDSRQLEVMQRYSRKADLTRVLTLLTKVAGQAGDGVQRESQSAARVHRIDVRLGQEERTALLDAYAAGRTTEDVASQFGLSKGSVRSVLHDEGARVRRLSTALEN